MHGCALAHEYHQSRNSTPNEATMKKMSRNLREEELARIALSSCTFARLMCPVASTACLRGAGMGRRGGAGRQPQQV